MFCKNCGQEIDDKAVVCPHCGVSQGFQIEPNDSGSVAWSLLGCCIPVVGLVLYLVWKDTKPKTAKAAGFGALVSVGLVLVWYIFVFALGVGGAMMF